MEEDHKRLIGKTGKFALWLKRTRAAEAYDAALRYCASDRYGLNKTRISDLAIYQISNHAETTAWLRTHLQPEDGTLQVLFNRQKVCELQASDFFDAWFDFFVPASELIILQMSSDAIVMYHHEDILEAGHRLRSDIDDPSP